MNLLSLHLESAISNLIYSKTLSVEPQESSGKIVNLLEVDTERASDFIMWADACILLPFDLIIAGGMLFYIAGWAGASGLAVFVVFLIFDIVIVFKLSIEYDDLLKAKDERMNIAVSLLEEIKTWKTLGIEKTLLNKLAHFRGLELKRRRRMNWMVSLSELSMWTAPSLAAVAVFWTQVYLLGEELTADGVFPVIMTLFVVQESIHLVPHAMCDMIQGVVSAGRIEDFLEEPDTTTDFQQTSGPEVSLRNATFAYEPEGEADLHNLTLDLAKGELVALVGPVGCGKSTLLDALLGEVKLRSGEYLRKGKFSYAAGLESWITNGSFRENVLLGRPFNNERYSAVLHACALDTDVSRMSNNDLTEIGERGINLSGGQKARLALARAVYGEADVYLFDDPLSAVDLATCKQVFKHCIRGLLQGKTILIATHAMQYLTLFDRVIVMQDGRVIEQSVPSQLKTDVTALIAKAAEEEASSDEEDDSEGSEDEGGLVDEEESAVGEVSREVYKTYFRYFGGYSAVILTFSLALFSEVSYAIGAFLIEDWEGDDSMAVSAVEMFTIFAGLCGVFAGLHFLCMTTFALRASAKLHNSMGERLVQAPVNLFFDVTPVGRILNRMSEDIEEVDEDLVWNFSSVMQCISSLLSTFFVCLYFAPPVILVVPIVIAVAYKLQCLYLQLQRELSRMSHVIQSPIISHLKASLDGAKSIRCFNNQRACIEFNQRLLDTHVRTEIATEGAEMWLTIGMDLLAGGVLVFVSWILILNRDLISPGVAGLCLVYLMPLAESINSAVKCIADLETAMVSVERIHAYTQVLQEAPAVTEADGKLAGWPRLPSIEFVDVSVKYRPGLPKALSNVSFKVEPGEKIGVIGRTGSGKSTLMLLMTRILEPQKGRVLIDGLDISTLGLAKLRTSISIIPQNPVLFGGSLRENLDPEEKADDSQMKRTLDRLKIPYKSLDDEVSDDSFSSGQRQLVCVARAVLRHSKILLLDEATSAIDPESESLVAMTLAEEFADSTVVTIAHRLSTVEQCSRLLVLDHGHVKAFGKTKKLLKRKDLASELKGIAA
jgi:ABC-type multidrug transport system fused ATPase/permease subunit